MNTTQLALDVKFPPAEDPPVGIADGRATPPDGVLSLFVRPLAEDTFAFPRLVYEAVSGESRAVFGRSPMIPVRLAMVVWEALCMGGFPEVRLTDRTLAEHAGVGLRCIPDHRESLTGAFVVRYLPGRGGGYFYSLRPDLDPAGLLAGGVIYVNRAAYRRAAKAGRVDAAFFVLVNKWRTADGQVNPDLFGDDRLRAREAAAAGLSEGRFRAAFDRAVAEGGLSRTKTEAIACRPPSWASPKTKATFPAGIF